MINASFEGHRKLITPSSVLHASKHQSVDGKRKGRFCFPPRRNNHLTFSDCSVRSSAKTLNDHTGDRLAVRAVAGGSRNEEERQSNSKPRLWHRLLRPAVNCWRLWQTDCFPILHMVSGNTEPGHNGEKQKAKLPISALEMRNVSSASFKEHDVSGMMSVQGVWKSSSSIFMYNLVSLPLTLWSWWRRLFSFEAMHILLFSPFPPALSYNSHPKTCQSIISRG